MKDKHTRGILCVLCGGFLWGFSGTCSQYLFMKYDFPADWLAAARMLCSGIILILFMVFKDRKQLTKIFLNKRDSLILLVFSCAGLLMCQLSYLKTISYSNSGTATVLEYLFPIMVIFFVCVTTPRKPKLREMIAIFLAILGVFLISTHGDPTSLVISKNALIWGLTAAVTTFIYSASPEGIIKKYGSIPVTGLGMLIGGTVLFIIIRGWQSNPISDFTSLIMCVIVCIVGTAVAFTLYLRGVGDIGPVKASMVASVEPVAATVISALWLRTKFYLVDIVGFALILAIIFITASKQKNIQEDKNV